MLKDKWFDKKLWKKKHEKMLENRSSKKKNRKVLQKKYLWLRNDQKL